MRSPQDTTPPRPPDRPRGTSWLRPGSLQVWQACLFAAAATPATLALRLALDGPLGGRPTLVLFTLPIMASAYVGGLGAGLLATVLSYFLASYYLLAPLHGIHVASAVDRWQLYVVLLAGVFISGLNEALHWARRRVDIATSERDTAAGDRQRFFALSQDVICILGFDGYFTDLNPAWEATLGYTRAEMLGTPFIEFVHPDDQAATLVEAGRVSEGHGLVAFENRYRCKDGSYRWLQWSVTPVLVDHVMYGVARDITEERRVNGALHDSERRFRFLNELAEATRALSDPGAIMAVTARMLGEHLGVSRCAYADVEADGDRFTILHDYTDGCATTVGTYLLSRFGARAVRTLGSGQTLIVRNVETELGVADGADMFQAIGIQAIITCPLVKDGRLRAMMAVHQTAPRDWQAAEIAIVEEVVERCWASIERRTAESLVAREQARMRRLVESNAQGVIFWNTKGEILKANDTFLGLVGYTRADLEAGRINWKTITPPEFADLDRQSLMQLAATGVCAPFEKEYLRKDGSRVSVMVGAALFDDNPTEGVCFVLDITPRKEAEEALVAAGVLQRAISESANFWSIVTDVKGVIQIFNVGAERMLGYTAAEVVNRITPAELQEPQELNARAVALSLEFAVPIASGFEALSFKASRGLEDISEVTKVRKDGTLFPAVLTVTALRDPNGAVIGYLFVGIDNTVRKQIELEREGAEAARQTSEGRYRTLFECAPDGILIATPESYYLDANSTMCRMLGYTRSEFVGLHASDIVVEAELPYIGEALEAITATSVHAREWRFRRKDGSVFDAEVIATQMPDGNLLGVVRDITERKRVETALQQKNLELEDA
ncbi:MAG: PAS domain S-box protein, partial [Acidobacteriota bacterium]